MRGDTLVDYGADFDVSWVFHDFGWEVPLIFLTLRIDMFGGGISRSLWKDWWGLGLWF
jgi:hypothetical protein